ncbi:MAG: ribonuclease P protein component [Prevotella sp.]
MTTTVKPLLTLGKEERLVSRKTIEKLFGGGNRSMVAYPIRMVYMSVESAEVPIQMMVSVSKRHFKHAVKRNRVKRLIREAYRKNKHSLISLAENEQKAYVLAFIYMSNDLFPYTVIEESISKLLMRLSDRIKE